MIRTAAQGRFAIQHQTAATRRQRYRSFPALKNHQDYRCLGRKRLSDTYLDAPIAVSLLKPRPAARG